MIRSLCFAAALSATTATALAQTAPAPTTAPAPATPPAPPEKTPPEKSAAPEKKPAETATPATPAKPLPPFDSEEFRRQVMEEVRKELQKAKDEVKQETAWVEQDSQARVQDSEAVEALKQRVNLFQPHGYLRMRGEFFNDMNLGRAPDPAGNYLFPGPFIGAPPGDSQSDANIRFRFAPTLEVSEDLSIHFTADMLDNVLIGTNPVSDVYITPYTPLAVFSNTRASSVVNVKRVWGRVNTQVGEFVFGRMGYHWGLGILHNDGNCLDCDYGDTYDRIAFAPREFKGHHLTVMLDLLDKGQTTTGSKGELGRSVDLDTLDDGYRLALEITRLDTQEEIKRRLDADKWVVNYGLVLDYRTQPWDTPVPVTTEGSERSRVVRRAAKIYQPDLFLSLKRKKWRLDVELAGTFGSIGTHQASEFDPATFDPATAAQLTKSVDFTQYGAALQSDLAVGGADAVLFGFEWGGASGDRGAYGFGARPWVNGSGNRQPTAPGEAAFNSAGRGDIDGGHLDFSARAGDQPHNRINNFVFNRAFNVDMILWRNLVTAFTSAWYLKPSIRWRPTGRKTGGGDDSGFEGLLSLMYSQAWFAENTPGLAKPLGLEFNIGITYDTTDRFHAGIAYGLLIPFSGMRNLGTTGNPSVAHAARFIVAIPF